MDMDKSVGTDCGNGGWVEWRKARGENGTTVIE